MSSSTSRFSLSRTIPVAILFHVLAALISVVAATGQDPRIEDLRPAVVEPGVYTLSPDSRLHEAVAAAGGVADDADSARINLADRVYDGQQVYVPARGARPPPQPTPGMAGVSPSGGAKETVAGGFIDINTASASELEALPGIGPTYAQRVIAYRQTNGPFSDPADIMRVKGIGPACFNRIKDQIIAR